MITSNRINSIQNSSKDSLGNDIVCYRFMGKNLYKNLHSQGEIIAAESLPTSRNLTADFTKYINMYFAHKCPHLNANVSLEEKMYLISGENCVGLKNIDTPLQQKEFIKKYFNTNFLLDQHIKSPYIDYSPFYSWSIGGHIGNLAKALYNNQNIYLEAVIPNEEILYSDVLTNIEKEILTTKIKVHWITAAYETPEEMMKNIMSKEVNIGIKAFCDNYKKMTQEIIEEIEDYENWKGEFEPQKYIADFCKLGDIWRYNTDTKNYLPEEYTSL